MTNWSQRGTERTAAVGALLAAGAAAAVGFAWPGLALHALAAAVAAGSVPIAMLLRRPPARPLADRLATALTESNSDFGFVLVDADDRIMLISRSLERLFPGLDTDDLIGRSYVEGLQAFIACGATTEKPMSAEDQAVSHLAWRRQPNRSLEARSPDGAWVRYTEVRLGDGWSVGTFTDVTDLKTRETELRTNEARLRDIAGATSEWFWETDAEHRFTYLSRGLIAHTGVAPDRYLGRSRREMMADLDDPAVAEHFDDLENRRPFREFEYRAQSGNGQDMYFSISGVPVFDENGAFLGYRGAGRDVTDRILAEQRALAAHARLSDALEAMRSALMLFDAAGRLAIANRRIREMYPTIAGRIQLGQEMKAIVSALAQSGLVAEARSDPECWVATEIERLQRADGAAMLRKIGDLWCENRAYRTRDGGVLVIEADVTPLVERDLKLQEQARLIEHTFNSMTQAIAAFDADLRLTTCNRRFLQLFKFPESLARPGTPIDEMVRHLHRNGVMTFDAEEEKAMIAHVRDMYRRRERDEQFFRLNDGTYIQLVRQPVEDGGVVATYLDVTERMTTERALRAARDAAESANRAKTRFLANISHELRTPLNSVIGFAEVIHDELCGPLDNRQYKEFAGDIRDSGRHLLAIINDILDLAKSEAGQRQIDAEPVSVRDAIDVTLRLVRQRAEQNGVTLAVETPDDVPPLQSEAKLLRQMLINLMSNAVKFTPQGGAVRIAAGLRPDGGLRITVTDTGIGIAQEDIPLALAPFAQIDSNLARKYEGTGLGLPLVDSLMKLHEGRLVLDSEPGKGTSAHLDFPASRVLAQVAGEAAAPDARQTPETAPGPDRLATRSGVTGK